MSEPVEKMPWQDRWKWWNAYLFIGCGAVMIYRSLSSPLSWLTLVTGIAFLLFGLYRLDLIRRVIRGEIKPAASSGRNIRVDPRWRR